jgi:hypothetical protein
MTAHELIADIFRRPQDGVAANMRIITRAQLDFLASLIGEDEDGGALERGRGLSFIWMPRGRDKYVVTEDPRGGRRHTLLRLSNIVPSGSGSLF